MIVGLIVACEAGFWLLLAAGLAVRYLLRLRRTSVALLLCEPLLEVVLFVVTAIDLRNGAEPSWEHGLAALYIGFTVAYGHYTIRWLDGHAAHRLAGGPPRRSPRASACPGPPTRAASGSAPFSLRPSRAPSSRARSGSWASATPRRCAPSSGWRSGRWGSTA